MKTTLVSRRSWRMFYLPMASVVLFVFLMSVALLMADKAPSRKVPAQSRTAIVVMFVIFLSLMVIYFVYRYFRNAPIVRLNESAISFNRHIFPLSSIAEVRLTGKQPFPFVTNSKRLEGTAIRFKDGSTKYFYDELYSNSAQLKSFLEEVVINKKDYVPPVAAAIDKEAAESETYEEFIGNQFTSFQGLTLWIFMGVLAIGVLTSLQKKNPPYALPLLIVFGLVWFLLIAHTMFYFRLSRSFFVVRNHNLPWKNTIYRLEDIREITFEQRARLPFCLRVITKDFRSKLYPAATLRDKTWLELKAALEQQGILVRNEVITET